MNPRFVILMALVAALLLQTGCGVFYNRSAPEGISARDLHDPFNEKKVLVASHKSEFKEKLVEDIEKAFTTKEKVYLKII